MKLAREPLLHFVVAGGLLFGAYSWLNRGRTGAGRGDLTVRITEREVAWLSETWLKTRQRVPNERELQGLVADYVREELLAREAVELELDRDDTVVRQRLARKMEFVLDDTAQIAEPSEFELHALFDSKRESFTEPGRSTLTQVYFNTEERGAQAEAAARAALAALISGRTSEPATLGDASLLPSGLVDVDEGAIASQFGPEFARAVTALAPGAWHGPIRSAFGVHLVRVDARQEAKLRTFDEVHAELAAEWRHQREVESKAAYFAALLRKYDVQVAESVRPLLGSSLTSIGGEAR